MRGPLMDVAYCLQCGWIGQPGLDMAELVATGKARISCPKCLKSADRIPDPIGEDVLGALVTIMDGAYKRGLAVANASPFDLETKHVKLVIAYLRAIGWSDDLFNWQHRAGLLEEHAKELWPSWLALQQALGRLSPRLLADLVVERQQEGPITMENK